MLTRCPNCGATVSTRSDECPQCHGRLHAPRKDVANRVFAWTFAAFNALMLAWIGFYMLTGRATLRAGTSAPGELGMGSLLLLWMLGLLVLGLCAMFNFAHRSAAEHSEHRRATR